MSCCRNCFAVAWKWWGEACDAAAVRSKAGVMCGAAAACIEEGDGDTDIAVSECSAYPFLKC